MNENNDLIKCKGKFFFLEELIRSNQRIRGKQFVWDVINLGVVGGFFLIFLSFGIMLFFQ